MIRVFLCTERATLWHSSWEVSSPWQCIVPGKQWAQLAGLWPPFPAPPDLIYIEQCLTTEPETVQLLEMTEFLGFINRSRTFRTLGAGGHDKLAQFVLQGTRSTVSSLGVLLCRWHWTCWRNIVNWMSYWNEKQVREFPMAALKREDSRVYI